MTWLREPKVLLTTAAELVLTILRSNTGTGLTKPVISSGASSSRSNAVAFAVPMCRLPDVRSSRFGRHLIFRGGSHATAPMTGRQFQHRRGNRAPRRGFNIARSEKGGPREGQGQRSRWREVARVSGRSQRSGGVRRARPAAVVRDPSAASALDRARIASAPLRSSHVLICSSFHLTFHFSAKWLPSRWSIPSSERSAL